MENYTLEDLAVDHDYYCSDNEVLKAPLEYEFSTCGCQYPLRKTF